jgi:hypothetical protein
MQMRERKWNEQATEIADTRIERQQQQDDENKHDETRKKTKNANYTTTWIQERLILITQLDGTGGHSWSLQMT